MFIALYRHGKTGKLYEFLGFAKHSETEEQLVVYRGTTPLGNGTWRMDEQTWARPRAMFFGFINGLPRFEALSSREITHIQEKASGGTTA